MCILFMYAFYYFLNKHVVVRIIIVFKFFREKSTSLLLHKLFKALFFLGWGAFLTLSIGISKKIHIICAKLTVRTEAESHIASGWAGGRYPLLSLTFTKLDNVHKVCYGHEYSDKLMSCNPHYHCVTERHLSNSVI